MTLKTVVLGGGGHARVVVEALEACGRNVAGWVGERPTNGSALNRPHLGSDSWLQAQGHNKYVLANGVGSVGDISDRAQVYNKYVENGFRFPSFVHPSAAVSGDFVDISGLQVMAGAVIQPGCQFGANVLINTSASIDHDCTIGDHVHVACGAVLSGGVTVAAGAHIGAGAVVLQGVEIGEEAIVGAGAVVIADVEPGELVVGNPAVRKPRP